MDLPEIPDAVYEAAEIDPDERWAVRAVWPHLYALALRDAAERMDGDEEDERWAAGCLRRMADSDATSD